MADSPAPIRKKMPTAEYSPTPGCAIFVIGAIAVVTFVVWFFYVGWKQKQLLAEITEASPANIATAQPTETEVAPLRQRLIDYTKAISENRSASLSLNQEEINQLLVSEKLLANVRNLISVESIGSAVTANISLPADGRYINGQAEFSLVVRPESGIYVSVDNISVPGKSVPKEFVKSYRDLDFLDILLLEPLRKDPIASLVLQKTTTVEIKDAALLLRYTPKK